MFVYICCCLVAKSCLTFCNTVDYSPLGCSAHGCPRQEYWNGLPFPSARNLPDLGIEPQGPALQVDSFTAEPLWKLWYSCLGNPMDRGAWWATVHGAQKNWTLLSD